MHNYNNLSVLFIDDNIAIRKMYVRMLEPYFSKVYEARDSESALKLYKEKKPDILVVDIHLPMMSGIEFLEIVRRDDHATRAIVFTADVTDSFLIKAAELKLTKYLVKNDNLDDFLHAISKAVSEIESFDIVSKNLVQLKDSFMWDLDKKKLLQDNEVKDITKTEIDILDTIFRNRKNITTYDELLESVWHCHDSTKLDMVKSAIKKLRKKLPKDTILNVYGEGYRAELSY